MTGKYNLFAISYSKIIIFKFWKKSFAPDFNPFLNMKYQKESVAVYKKIMLWTNLQRFQYPVSLYSTWSWYYKLNFKDAKNYENLPQTTV